MGSSPRVSPHTAVPTLPGPRVHDRATPAERFIRACGRSVLSPERLARLRAAGLGLSHDDWYDVLGVAIRGGMESLAYTHAAAAGLLDGMPEQIVEALKGAYITTLTDNLRLRNEQLRLLDGLRERNVPAVPFKGIALALRYYGEPSLALRPVGDMDLLIHRADAEAAAAALRAMGYAPLYGDGGPHSFEALRNAALVYRRVPDGPMVELHWRLASVPPYAQRFAATDVWARLGTQEIAGRTVPYLTPGDELRYLCFHYAAQHQAARLIWLVDIAELVRALPRVAPEWSWQAFAEETRALGLALPVVVALERAVRLVGLEFPEWVLDALAVAAAQPAERGAWRAAQEDFYHPASLARRLRVLDSHRERLVMARVIAARAPRIWASWGRKALREQYRRLRRRLAAHAHPAPV
ncbi:MAG TPA: nucleotidyltransferase family protein [Ktedonobacterales bacterium]|nr:nucleotidyltransferase family protein [Ktedonobacterales bacterium]